jgi:hypothetical protein
MIVTMKQTLYLAGWHRPMIVSAPDNRLHTAGGHDRQTSQLNHLATNLATPQIESVAMKYSVLLATIGTLVIAGCTQETQNKIGRSLQNWTGANGVLEVYAGDKLAQRFIKIDKLSTAMATEGGGSPRPYRFGYGVLDANQDGVHNDGERKVYFEVSDYSTNYVFYGDPGS